MRMFKGCAGLILLVPVLVAEDPPPYPLHEALKAKAYDRALEVLRLTTEVDAPDSSGHTPLCLAANNRKADAYDVAIALLRHGANPNMADSAGYAPLHYAAKAGNLAVVEALVRYGAKVNAEYGPPGVSESEPGWTPLYIARLKNRRRVASFLVERGGKVHEAQEQNLAYEQRVADLLEAARSTPDVSVEDYEQMTNAERLAYAYEEALSASIRAGREIGIDPEKVLYLEALKHQMESRLSSERPSHLTEAEWLERVHREVAAAATASVAKGK